MRSHTSSVMRATMPSTSPASKARSSRFMRSFSVAELAGRGAGRSPACCLSRVARARFRALDTACAVVSRMVATSRVGTPSAQSRDAWKSWFDAMGDHLVESGRRVCERTAIGNCSPTNTELGGYSVIHAEDFDAAAAIAKGCPYLDRDGGVEIGLLVEIPAEVRPRKIHLWDENRIDPKSDDADGTQRR